MRKKEKQQQERHTVRVQVIVPVSITNLGTLDAGVHELDPDLAELLVARGFAKPIQGTKEEVS